MQDFSRTRIKDSRQECPDDVAPTDMEISWRGYSKILLVVFLAACVGCSQGSARRVLPDAGEATDAMADAEARSDAAADVKDATDATQNGDGGADQTNFSCGGTSCRAPAEYCYGTEGPGGPLTRLAYNGCNSTHPGDVPVRLHLRMPGGQRRRPR